MTNEQQVILQRRYKNSIGHKGLLHNLKRDLNMIISNETGNTDFHYSMLDLIRKELNNSE